MLEDENVYIRKKERCMFEDDNVVCSKTRTLYVQKKECCMFEDDACYFVNK